MTTLRGAQKSFRSSSLAFVTMAVVGCSSPPSNTPLTLRRVDVTLTGISSETVSIVVSDARCDGSVSSPTGDRMRALSADLCREVKSVFGNEQAFASLGSVPDCGGSGDDIRIKLVSATTTSTSAAIGACVGASRAPYVGFFDTVSRARTEILR